LGAARYSIVWLFKLLTIIGSALDLDSLDGDRNSSEQPSHNGSQIGRKILIISRSPSSKITEDNVDGV
jgi:hypothetical protein